MYLYTLTNIYMDIYIHRHIHHARECGGAIYIIMYISIYTDICLHIYMYT